MEDIFAPQIINPSESSTQSALKELFSGEFDRNEVNQKIEQAEYLTSSMLKLVETQNQRRIKLVCSKQKCPLAIKLELNSSQKNYHLRELVGTHNHRISLQKFEEKMLTSKLLRYSDLIYEKYFETESEYVSKPKLIIKDLKAKHKIDIMAGNYSSSQKLKLKKKFDNIVQQLRQRKLKSDINGSCSAQATRSTTQSLSTNVITVNTTLDNHLNHNNNSNSQQQATGIILPIPKSSQNQSNVHTAMKKIKRESDGSECKVEQDQVSSFSVCRQSEEITQSSDPSPKSDQKVLKSLNQDQQLNKLDFTFNNPSQNIVQQSEQLQHQFLQQSQNKQQQMLLMGVQNYHGLLQNILSGFSYPSQLQPQVVLPPTIFAQNQLSQVSPSNLGFQFPNNLLNSGSMLNQAGNIQSNIIQDQLLRMQLIQLIINSSIQLPPSLLGISQQASQI